MVNEHSLGFYFFEKNVFCQTFCSTGMSRYALILAYTMAKFYAGFQLFDMKITSEGKPGLKIAFLRSDSTYGEAQYEVQGGVGIQGPCIPPSPSSPWVFNFSA